ncbi:MAG: hypothetical protein ACR2JS_03420 [Candidatus Nanopelagicales bacterium]
MSELTLFNNNLPDYLKEVELDDVTKALAGGGGSKRISLRGSKFRMVVNGDEVMTSKNDALEVVIVNAAKDVSRQYYGSAYNPKADATPPDCWSNDGIAPDKSIKEAQHHNCAECPQNIKGSGSGESRACRHFRRLAVALANDVGGDVYQLQLASKSIFGKGDLEHMPFEQYAKYVGAQGYNLNTLVTEMRFDTDSDTAKLFFKPLKFLSREEWETAKRQADTPSAKNAIAMTVAQTDGVKKIAAPAPKLEKAVAEEVAEPKKREEKKAEPTAKRDLKSVMSGWSSDDE